MKKTLCLILSLTLFASLATACGKDKDTAEPSTTPDPTPKVETKIKGEITVGTNRTDLADTLLPEYEQKFKDKYPEVTAVKFEPIADYGKNMKIRLSTGDYPDVILIPDVALNELPNYFEPLDDIGLNDKIMYKNDFSYDGKVYGMPIGGVASGVIYNKKAYEKAGITAIPKTVDEFYAAMEKLKEAGIVPVASNYKDSWTLWDWERLALGYSGDTQHINKRAETDTPFQVDSPLGTSLTIFKTLIDKKLVEKDIYSTNWEDSKRLVGTGEYGNLIIGNYVIPQIISTGAASEDIGFYPLPMDNSGKSTAVLKPDYFLGVNKNSKNVDTAKEFVKWWVEESGYADHEGFMPVLKGSEPAMAQLKEFMSYEPTLTEMAGNTEVYTKIGNEAQIQFKALAQEAVVKDMQTVFDEYNAKWAKARAKVNAGQ